MEKIMNEIKNLWEVFEEDANRAIEKGIKARARQARVTSSKLGKALKEFRKISKEKMG